MVATTLSNHYSIIMADLSKSYKACVFDQPGKILTGVVDIDMPEPSPGEMLVDLSVDRGTQGLRPPTQTEFITAHIQASAIPTPAS